MCGDRGQGKEGRFLLSWGAGLPVGSLSPVDSAVSRIDLTHVLNLSFCTGLTVWLCWHQCGGQRRTGHVGSFWNIHSHHVPLHVFSILVPPSPSVGSYHLSAFCCRAEVVTDVTSRRLTERPGLGAMGAGTIKDSKRFDSVSFFLLHLG